MVSLWKTKPGGERSVSPLDRNDNDNEEAPRIVVEAPEEAPNEHTRLLPQPSTRDGREGYLSPDDPAVSFEMESGVEHS